MNVDSIRAYCLAFPDATEKLQWEDNLCFKLGGKIFAMLGLDRLRLCFKRARCFCRTDRTRRHPPGSLCRPLQVGHARSSGCPRRRGTGTLHSPVLRHGRRESSQAESFAALPHNGPCDRERNFPPRRQEEVPHAESRSPCGEEIGDSPQERFPKAQAPVISFETHVPLPELARLCQTCGSRGPL